MRIEKVKVNNFRLLRDSEITLDEKTTVIVGRNNSGKTSFTEVFRRFLSDGTAKFKLEDFSIPIHEDFWNAFILMKEEKEDQVRDILPYIQITLTLKYDINTDNLGPLGEFVIDLDPSLTHTVAVVRYQLADGKIPAFFEGIEYTGEPEKTVSEKKNFFRVIKERVPLYFSTSVYAIDPQDPTNQKKFDLAIFRELLQTGFINAQRGLDDTTHKDSDVLGSIVERMLDIAKSETSDNETLSLLENSVKEIQFKLDTDFNQHVNKLLPALSLFGYPGLSTLPLHTETTLDVKRLLENHTKVHYPGEHGINLPETYNGLGSRNLIYILFKLYEFFKLYKARKTAANFHLIFIEEPEAHMHPQMQEVFIRKLTEIANEFSCQFNDGSPWPVQFVITTHSTHIANEAPFDSIRYFINTGMHTRVKDLKLGFSNETKKDDKEFLHKYLTLTKCDLFFADKAILIEGPTERILMPKIIEKVDSESAYSSPLSSKYLTIIEVGGAYAHHFFSLLNFLELRTLIITDIDSVDSKNREKCIVSEGAYTSNACIKKWFNENDLSPISLLNKTEIEKTNGLLRLAYQVPEFIELGIGEMSTMLAETAAAIEPVEMEKVDTRSWGEIGPTGRSFEDAFMLANRSLFDIKGNNSEELERSAWQKALKVDKTNFALKYALEETTWNVPAYIKQGLAWLSIN
jgi:predicted ATP-dependent endonuclease of OLD family